MAALPAFLVSVAFAQTYPPPTPGDFGSAGPFSVNVDTFTNPVYPTANGQTLIVSVFHPGTTVNPALPTVFLAHGYTTPIGNATNYLDLLNNLASWGCNVVFSPYEGGLSPNIGQRFDELTTGFEAAVTNFGLNTAQVGFVGHSYGGGFLPSVVLHEMMGKADLYRPGTNWGGAAAFFYSMAPGYAYGGGAQTDVSTTQTIFFPTNLNVVEQAFYDDTSFADPRLAIDIFYNVTTPNSQKDFYTTFGDSRGTNTVVADHFLPNIGSNSADFPLQSWGILRRLDALAAWTFAGDAAARTIALGHGVSPQTDQGLWSDDTAVTPLGVTDLPAPSAYDAGPYVVQWGDAANPRSKYPLFSGPPAIAGVAVAGGKVLVTVTNLLANHNYIEQQAPGLVPGSWSNAVSFTLLPTGLPTNFVLTLTNGSSTAPAQFWRINAP